MYVNYISIKLEGEKKKKGRCKRADKPEAVVRRRDIRIDDFFLGTFPGEEAQRCAMKAGNYSLVGLITVGSDNKLCLMRLLVVGL